MFHAITYKIWYVTKGGNTKLYEVPNHTVVCTCEDAKIPPASLSVPKGTVLKLYDIDGMYARCKNETGEWIYPAAWTEVEIVKV